MAAKQGTTERALRHLIRRATRERNWDFVRMLFWQLGMVYEEEAENGSLPASTV